MDMKKSVIVIVLLTLLALGIYNWVRGIFNNLVALDEGVQQARSQVENQYQRRADLIPNLVSVVEWFADQEFDTLTTVTQARASATQTTVDVNDAESMAQFQAVQGELSSALSRLLVSVEAYPDLKSNQNFLELQAQLEGTENRIATERGRYNEVVRNYNIIVRSFPTNIIANIFDFNRATLFEAENGAAQVPDVEFDFSDRNTEDTTDIIETTNTQINQAIDIIDTTIAN